MGYFEEFYCQSVVSLERGMYNKPYRKHNVGKFL